MNSIWTSLATASVVAAFTQSAIADDIPRMLEREAAGVSTGEE